MTQGGPLQSTVSVLYFMYEEGFKWWNLGYASAVAFLLFLLIFAVTLLQLRQARRGGAGNDAAARGDRSSTACCSGASAFALFPLLWMLSVSFMAPGRGEHAIRRRSCRARRRSPTTASCSRTRAWAAISRTACCSRSRRRRCRCVFNVTAGYAFAKLRFAGRDRIFQLLLGRAGDSRRRWRWCRCSCC